VITSGITNDNRPSLSGSGEPGALVLLHDGDTLIASFRVDADGNWTWQPDEALKDGEHRFSLSHRDAAGNTSAPSVPVSLTVDTVPPTAPRVIAVLDNVAGGVENGAALADGAPTNDSRPLFTGSAEPGAIITLMIDGMVQASLRVAEDGQWRWQPVAALPDGEHRFTAL
ncbi:Ig-like domain-containing protein, partial [Pantoea trifolii]|uniref:Ig-like domain-containing protein n=1 Tax=Candidatus Pantoea symbiotica TaxID=1884370 RepID=UPI002413926F